MGFFTSTEGQQFVFQDISGISSFIHEIQFGDHTNGSQTYSHTHTHKTPDFCSTERCLVKRKYHVKDSPWLRRVEEVPTFRHSPTNTKNPRLCPNVMHVCFNKAENAGGVKVLTMWEVRE